MILSGGANDLPGDSTTLDQLFRRAAIRHPDRLALADPPNRSAFTDDAPRELTFAQADRAIWACATRLRALRLPVDAVVALQLPNTIESVIAILGALRAGLVPALLPPLWRHRDMAVALAAVSAKAIVTMNRVGAANPCEQTMTAAANLFQVRNVASFGANVPDGVIGLDDIFDHAAASPVPAGERTGNPAAHVAAITFDTTLEGIVPVARSHRELMAGGLAIVLEGRLAQDGNILTTLPLASFAALSAALLPWLIGGGSLMLHQPFDAQAFAAQSRDHTCDAVVVPGGLADRIESDTTTIIAVWPPEQQSVTPSAPHVIDVVTFGEIGLVPLPRERSARPRLLPRGVVSAPLGSPAAVKIVETSRTARGTLALRGAMVPAAALPVAAVPGARSLEVADDGCVDTAYPCRTNGAHLAVTGPQAGIVRVGGSRFPRFSLDQVPNASGTGGVIVAVPDALLGQRLAGSTRHLTITETKLAGDGYDTLIVQAFRRRGANAA